MEIEKVIETRFFGPTNFRGSRIKASDNNENQITIGFDYSLSGIEAHYKAAYTLCKKMGWEGKLVGGWSKSGCAFVLVNRKWQDGARGENR